MAKDKKDKKAKRAERSDGPVRSDGPEKGCTTLQIFGAGLFATVVIYCVYYLKHPSVVTRQHAEHGVVGVLLATFCLLVFAAMGGFWAVVNKPGNLKRAFTIGLGWPAMWFAVDLGASEEDGETLQGSLGMPRAALASSDGGSILSSTVRMFLAPVSSVSRAERREADQFLKKARRERQAAVRLQRTAEEERDQAEGARDRIQRRYDGQVADLRAAVKAKETAERQRREAFAARDTAFKERAEAFAARDRARGQLGAARTAADEATEALRGLQETYRVAKDEWQMAAAEWRIEEKRLQAAVMAYRREARRGTRAVVVWSGIESSLQVLGTRVGRDLSKVVESEAPAERRSAIAILPHLGPRVSRSLIEMASRLARRDPDVGVRMEAAYAGLHLRGDSGRASELISAGLKEDDPELRLRAAGLLGLIGRPAEGALPMLMSLAREDSNPRVQELAVWAVEMIRGE